jgi:hypothetical protein
VVIELGRHQPVQKGFLEFTKQAVLAHHRRRVMARQQLVNQLVPDGHGRLLQPATELQYDPSHKITDRLGQCEAGRIGCS